MITIYDAARCPYCARVRIVLAEKGIEHELVQVDLDERPGFLLELNPPAGRVPILETEIPPPHPQPSGLRPPRYTLVLPESAVINEYLEERYPEPALLPADPAARALARFAIERFDDFGDPYYDLYFKRPTGSVERLDAVLSELDRRLDATPYLAGASYSLADIAYVPWIFRAETRLGFDLSPYTSIQAWAERLLERPAVAAERDVVLAL
jgi:glutathione S-transferase